MDTRGFIFCSGTSGNACRRPAPRLRPSALPPAGVHPAARCVHFPRAPRTPEMSLIVRLLINAAALYAATRFVSGISFSGSGGSLLAVALLFAIVNTLIKPFLQLLSLPVLFLTLGLFALVINALMLMLTSALSASLGLGFSVDGFLPALVGSVIVSLISAVLNAFLGDRND